MLTATREISNSDDVIDSRDVIERIEELETEIADAHEDGESSDVLDMKAELTALKALAEEAEGSPDWRYGETLIRASYFKEYAQRLAEDCDMIPRDLKWPCNCIDWDQAARQLKMDYFTVDFAGVDYLIRA